MDDARQTEIAAGYSRLVRAAWADEKLADRLASSPREVLSEFGLAVPATAEIRLVRPAPPQRGAGAPLVETQLALWAEGQRSGIFELRVPQTPQLDTEELSEGDLATVAGGAFDAYLAPGVTWAF